MEPTAYQPNGDAQEPQAQNASTPTPQPEPVTQTPPPQQPIMASAEGIVSTDYVSNPFTVGFRHLATALKVNPLGVLLTPLVIFGCFFALLIVGLIFSATRSTPGSILALLVIIIDYLLVFPLAMTAYYTLASKNTQQEKVTTKEVLGAAMKKMLPMLLLLLAMVVLISLGLIVLIIPGLIILARISLAPAVMVAENLGVGAAITRSFSLTKGHFFEMLGAVVAGAFISGNGLLAPYVGVSQMMGRYEDLKALEGSAAKPKVHWMNYAILAVIIVAVVGYITFFATVLNSAQNQAKRNQEKSEQLLNDSIYQYDRSSSGNFNYDY